ncbi:hypothetical protein RJ639_009770 [Escallonia herrerae]|uniref:Uncharacterized protein n=1 Tax=Escallonia herrerae TaxID=1293975 RepID=A0AA88VT52_9ASTE|nr:hypothetical protein RJ639_009770 [Escallonia herrerae]
MSSKTLVRTGVTLMNRLTNSLVPRSLPRSNHQVLSKSLDVATPKLSPSPLLTKLHNPLDLQQYEDETLRRISSPEGPFYPCGLPSLRFFLPDAGDVSSDEPMLLLPKRTYQPSTLRRKRLYTGVQTTVGVPRPSGNPLVREHYHTKHQATPTVVELTCVWEGND